MVCQDWSTCPKNDSLVTSIDFWEARHSSVTVSISSMSLWKGVYEQQPNNFVVGRKRCSERSVLSW